jgi:zinc transport system substrate-binding protein
MARSAYNAITTAYPDSSKYAANYQKLEARLDSLDRSVRTLCDKARVRQFIIYHPALTYLARDYGLEQISIEHEGKEPSAKRLAGIINNARTKDIKRLFYQSTYPRSTVEVIADDIGAEAFEIDPLREDIFVNIEEMIRLITE